MNDEFDKQAKALLESDDYRSAVEDRLASMQAEYAVEEEAPWFGATGLPEDWERELPRYLRRELGESLSDDGALKAQDLEYLGAFPESGGETHFWRVPFGGDEAVYAYIETAGEGCLGWGNRTPPK